MNNQATSTTEEPIETNAGATGNSLDNIGEDTAAFIAENWTKLIWAFFLTVGAVIGVNYWKVTSSERVGRISDSFSAVQQTFSATDFSEKQTLFKEQLKAVEENGPDSTYAEMIKVYEAAGMLRKGEIAEAKSVLKPYLEKELSSSNEKEALAAEFANLLYARALIQENGAGTKESFSLLEKLVTEAQIVNLEALVSLLRTSETDSEKRKIESMALTLAEESPEIRKAISRELSIYGLKLD